MKSATQARRTRAAAKLGAWAWPIFGLSLLPLMAQAAPALPTGGSIKSGAVVIGAPSASQLTINQSSAKAIINWNSFSIGQGGTVQFNNGSGSTLNRVTGASASSIDGLLSATGAVYLVNPNGIVISKTGVVNTGGTFVASSLDIPDTSYLAGGALTFSGASTASVVNLGQIGASGGDVALIAQTVENDATITAANGDVGLLAGSQVTLSDTLSSNGKFQVTLGSGASATNTGQITAAIAELRAYGGNVYALAGNTGGAISATGVGGAGDIWLEAPNGTVSISGGLAAQGAGGAAGMIDTSGQSVQVTGATVNAHGGAWAINAQGLEITQSAAAAISQSLATNAVTATSLGTGNLQLDTGAPLQWSSNNALILKAGGALTLGGPISLISGALNLTAGRSIAVDAPISVSGAGAVGITSAYNTSLAPGASVLELSFATGASITYGSTNQGGKLNINGQAYTLLYSLSLPSSTGTDQGADDIAGIANNSAAGGLKGDYALATSVTQPSNQVFTGALVAPGENYYSGYFQGVFEGLGNTISNLTINDPTKGDRVALFANLGGPGSIIRDLGLVGGSVTLTGTGVPTGDGYVAGILANNNGMVANVWTSGTVIGAAGDTVGGVVAMNYGGTVVNSFAAGAVSGAGGGQVGDLVGANHYGRIVDSYATGPVSGGGASSAGGLVGDNGSPNGGIAGSGTITDAYATGRVTGGAGSLLGGLSGGAGGNITNGYYDANTTGLSAGAQTNGSVGLTNTQMLQAASFAGFDFSATGAWRIVQGQSFPYLASQFAAPSSGSDNTPDVIAGTVYGSLNGAPVSAGLTVDGLVNGAAVGAAYTGANGYYQILVPRSSIQNGDVLTYLTGAQKGDAFADGVTGSIYGLNIYAGGLTIQTSATSLSAVTANLSRALGANSGPNFLFSTPGGVLTPAAGANLSIQANGGFTVDQALNIGAGTLALQASGPLALNGAISLANGALDLASSAAIAVDAPVSISGAGAVNITAADSSSISGSPLLDLSFATGASINYGSVNLGGRLSINGQAYTLLYALSLPGSTGPDQGTNDIAGIGANSAAGGLQGHYALATSVTQPTNQVFTGPLVGPGTNYYAGYFQGVFEGLGNTISNLTINDPVKGDRVALFGSLGGPGATIRDLGLLGGSITLTGTGTPTQDGYVAGILAGNNGMVANVWTSGTVIGAAGDTVGGVVAMNYGGTVVNSFATGAITGAGGGQVGDLVGANHYGRIVDSYATGPVSGGGASSAGGLVGDNGSPNGGIAGSGTITDAYATGRVTGGAGSLLGGLSGGSGGNITNGYYDANTTGLSAGAQANGSVGLTNNQMLQAASFAGFDFSATGAWRIVQGQSFPYLASQFASAPGVLSGTATGSFSTSPLAGVTVSGLANGAVVGSASTGANGYYQILTAPSALQGADVLTYLTGVQKGDAFEDGVMGAASNLNITAGGLNVQTHSTSLSALSANIATALGDDGGPNILFSVAGGVLTPTAGDNLSISAQGGFTVDQALNLGSGALSLTAGGTLADNAALGAQTVSLSTTAGGISLGAQVNGASGVTLASAGDLTEWGAGAINTPSFSGSADGVVWLSGPNQITTLTAFSNTGAGGFGLTDGHSLTISGPLAAGSGNLWLTDTNTSGIIFNAPVTAGGTGYIASSGGITFDSALTLGGALQLYSNYGVGQSASSVITTAALSGSAAAGLYLPGANQIATLAGFTNYGSGITVNDARSLTVTGAVNAGPGNVNIGTTAGTLTINAPVTASGTAYLYGQSGLTLNGDLTANTAQLNSQAGDIGQSQGAGINAATLNTYSFGSTRLIGPNSVNALAGAQAGGGFTLDDAAPLTVTGNIKAGGAISLADLATVNGDITLAPNVTIATIGGAGIDVSAYRNINLGTGALISAAGGGSVTLYADDTGTGTGDITFGAGARVSTTGAVSIFYDPSVNPAGSAVNNTSYVGPSENFAHDVTGGATLTAYMLVNTLADLQNVENNLSGTYAQGRDISGSVDQFGQRTAFTPIGSAATPFTGIFDGQNHALSNLLIQVYKNGVTQNSGSDVGIFGYSLSALFENIDLSNIYFNSYFNGNDVGGLVGHAVNTTIISTGIKDSLISGSTVGGLVGYLDGGSIFQSYSSANVGGPGPAGGLVGYAVNSLITSSYADQQVGSLGGYGGGLVGETYNTTISKSYATGDVGYINEFGGSTFQGGLVGSAIGGAISESYATGKVSGSYDLGGLVGSTDGVAISDSYASGKVFAHNYREESNSGGLIGYSKGGSISRSYSTVNISGEGRYWDLVVGGLIAANTGTVVTDSYWDVKLSGYSYSAGGQGISGFNGLPHDFDPAIWTQANPSAPPHLRWESAGSSVTPISSSAN